MRGIRRVAITGIGVVSPLGSTLDKFWDSLVQGRSGIVHITKFPITPDYITQIAGEVRDCNLDDYIPPKEQKRMDPFAHWGMCAAKMAMQHSGLDLAKEDPGRIGVIVSSGIGGLQILQKQTFVLYEKGPRRFSPFMIPQMITNILAGLIAIEYSLKGPNFCVVSACASATHSIGEAARVIQYGDADIMLAGGAEAPVCELGVGGFNAMRALSTRNDAPEKASRPFDAERDGFVMGEGSGVLVLEEWEHAVRRGAQIHGELAGYGRNCDAYHMTAPDEAGAGAAQAMTLAMQDAGVNPDEVGYINAHGTSTPLNDKCETLAIKQAFGDALARKTMISSTKSMTGHLLGAAGAVESVACILAMNRGAVPPTINYEHPDPDCDLDYVPNTAREARVKVCLNNSLGFGGHNATLCFKAV